MKSTILTRGALAAALLFPLGIAAYDVTVGNGSTTVRIEPVAGEIIRVTTFPTGQSVKLAPSQAVVLEEENPYYVDTNLTDDEFTLSIDNTKVKLDRKKGTISFYREADGSLLISEALPLDNASEVKSVAFLTPEGDYFYGAGERGHSLTLNGDSLTFYNRQNYGYTEGDPRISQMGISVPLLISDRGYGIFIDDYNKADMVVGADTITYTSNTPKPLSYYFLNSGSMFHEPTPAETLGHYTRLTGRQPLPPLWALGYITSKYGYHTQDEALGVIDTLKSRGYPVDGIVLDLYWYGKETDMGRLAWNPEQWPDHRQMLRQLKDDGVNTVIITQPYINKIGALDNYNLLDSLGLLTKDAAGNTKDVTTWVGEAGMFDMANPATREWLWNRLRPLTEEGVAGWWGDLGEPEVHPLEILHANGETAEQFHNAYGNVWSSLIYEGLRKDFPEMRPLLMMRGGTAGLQRYGVMPWTTDVSRSWGGLQPQVKLMLSSGMSGLGYMGSDVGGFAVDPENPTDPELYVRWLQMGTFSPMLRTHAQLKPEPYHYPEYEEISKRYIKMRYEWLPYNYTLAFQNAAFGYPLARPLNFNGDNPGREYAAVEDEYLWGDEVLVAPVMQQGATSREVLFPAGEWIDFFNPKLQYKGGTRAVVEAPLDKLPLFVRKGSFIPLYLEPVKNVRDYNPEKITVMYYPLDVLTAYMMYDDNHLSPTSLEDIESRMTVFTGIDLGDTIEITVEPLGGSFEGMPVYKHMAVEVVNVKKPSKVTYGDVVIPEVAKTSHDADGWHYDEATGNLTVVFPYDTEPDEMEIFRLVIRQ